MIRKALALRVRYVPLPADEFDPSSSDVRGFAHQLVRTRTVLASVFVRPSTSVRFELRSVGGGRMLSVVDVPASGRAVLESATLHQVELRRADTLDWAAMGLRPDIEQPGDGSEQAGS
jgi:hypothetical protein